MRMTEEEYTAFMQKRNQQGMRAVAREEHAAIHGETLSGAPRQLPHRGSQEGKRSKYGNRRVTVDGLKFDSKHEAELQS